jgi:hypothetical protein
MRNPSELDRTIGQAILQWNTIRAMDATTLGLTAPVNMDVLSARALSEAAQHLLVVTRARGHKTGELLLASVQSGLAENLESSTIVLYECHRATYAVVRPIGMRLMEKTFETIAISGTIGRGSPRASELIAEALHRCQRRQPTVEAVSILVLIGHPTMYPLIDEILLDTTMNAGPSHRDHLPTLVPRPLASIRHVQH